MDKKTKIINYLVEKYSPIAIVLTGSRVSGKNREDSDWDIEIFVDNNMKILPEKYDGENLDLGGVSLPIDGNFVLKNGWGPYKNIEILYDPKDIAKNIVKRTSEVYTKGPEEMSYELRQAWIQKLNRIYSKMAGTKDNKVSFMYNFSLFYPCVLKLYFQFQGMWSQPIYDTESYIKDNDGEFHLLLTEFLNNDYDLNKAKEIIKYLENLN